MPTTRRNDAEETNNPSGAINPGRVENYLDIAQGTVSINNLRSFQGRMEQLQRSQPLIHTFECEFCERTRSVENEREVIDTDCEGEVTICVYCLGDCYERCEECELYCDGNSDHECVVLSGSEETETTQEALGTLDQLKLRKMDIDAQLATGQMEYRQWWRGEHPHQSNETGEYVRSSRLFSTEIECYFPDKKNLLTALKSLSPALGVQTDGSLNQRGLEFQTPVVKGSEGEKLIVDTCDTLVKNKFSLDHKTGLHVHIDGAGYFNKKTGVVEHLKRLMAFYVMFEDVLLSFMPHGRRVNRFCLPIRDSIHLKEILDSYDIHQLESVWYRIRSKRDISAAKKGKYHSSRYTGFNFHSLFSNRHFEVRHHSGTLNARKILEWANLHCIILDSVLAKINMSQIEDVKHIVSLTEKTDIFFGLLGLSKQSEQYFKKRQNKFLKSEPLEEESLDAKLNEPCVA